MNTVNPAYTRQQARWSDASAGHLRGILAHLEAAKLVHDRPTPWLDYRADAALAEVEPLIVDAIIAIKSVIETLEIEIAPLEGKV